MSHDEPTRNLMSAIRKGLLAGAVQAIDCGADVNAPDLHGRRGLPLRIASFHGYDSIVKALLSHGAQANGYCDASDENSPIQAALRGKHTSTIQLLMEYGASLPEGYEFTSFATVSAITRKQALFSTDVANRIEAGQFEEISIGACYGVDTNILDQDLLRASEKAQEGSNAQMEPLTIPETPEPASKRKRWMGF